MLNVNEARKLVPVMDAVTSAMPEKVGRTMLPSISKIFELSVKTTFLCSVMSTSSSLLSTAVTTIIACWYCKLLGTLNERLNGRLLLASTSSELG